MAPATGQACGTPSIGTVTFEGKGYTHNDVAAWLKALAEQKGYTDPTSPSRPRSRSGPRTRCTFTSQAVITDDALSSRLHRQGGQLT